MSEKEDRKKGERKGMGREGGNLSHTRLLLDIPPNLSRSQYFNFKMKILIPFLSASRVVVTARDN